MIRIYATKTKTWRMVPLSDHFIEQLKDHQKEAQTDYVVEYDGRSIKVSVGHSEEHVNVLV